MKTVINKIIDRALAEIPGLDETDRLMFEWKIGLIYEANPYSIRWNDLLNGRSFDFIHDIAGMVRHYDLETGQYENCFQPRYTDYERADK